MRISIFSFHPNLIPLRFFEVKRFRVEESRRGEVLAQKLRSGGFNARALEYVSVYDTDRVLGAGSALGVQTGE